jgi:hypothetical protein
MTVNGWVFDWNISKDPEPSEFEVYMEEIPANAIRVESRVLPSETMKGKEGFIWGFSVPMHLVGKKCQVIIIPED